MSRNKNRKRQIKFGETLWNHVAEVEVGPAKLVWDHESDDQVVAQAVRRAEHYGRKENCAKCRRDRTRFMFSNELSDRGKLVYLAGSLAALATSMLAMFLLK